MKQGVRTVASQADDPATKRVIGYARVSTEGQAVEGVSLEAQRAKLAGWARANDLALAEADLFIDAGISGKRADTRPGLQAAIDAACDSGGVLVVYSLSRLARSTKDTITIAERLEAAGADLVSLTEKIDTTTASGKMVFRLLAVLAEFERDLVSERTRGALAHKRAKGERTGQVPFGRRVGDGGRLLEPEPAEASALEDARRWRAEGWSYRRIAAELTAAGVPTKNGGAAWSHSTVHGLFNPTSARKPKARTGARRHVD